MLVDDDVDQDLKTTFNRFIITKSQSKTIPLVDSYTILPKKKGYNWDNIIAKNLSMRKNMIK